MGVQLQKHHPGAAKVPGSIICLISMLMMTGLRCQKESVVSPTVHPNVHRAESYDMHCPSSVQNSGFPAHVTYPRGDEIFYVGDTVYIGFCDKDESNPQALGGCVSVYFNGGKKSYSLEESECGDNTNPMIWVIPDSVDITLPTDTAKVMASLAGDGIRIRLTDYSSQDLYNSSGSFSIRNP